MATSRNWSRFLHRIWFVLASIWLIVAASAELRSWYEQRPGIDVELMTARCRDKDTNAPTPAPVKLGTDTYEYHEPTPDECIRAALSNFNDRHRLKGALKSVALFGIGLPLSILAVGHAIAWAIRGLRMDGAS